MTDWELQRAYEYRTDLAWEEADNFRLGMRPVKKKVEDDYFDYLDMYLDYNEQLFNKW